MVGKGGVLAAIWLCRPAVQVPLHAFPISDPPGCAEAWRVLLVVGSTSRTALALMVCGLTGAARTIHRNRDVTARSYSRLVRLSPVGPLYTALACGMEFVRHSLRPSLVVYIQASASGATGATLAYPCGNVQVQTHSR